MQPFLYWAGNKRKQAEWIADLVRDRISPTGRYFEPFAGSAAVAFELARPLTTISDSNADLIKTYRVLTSHAAVVQCELNLLVSLGTDKGAYLAIRNTYNHVLLTAPRHAAHFIYLNRLGYSGLYRVNSKNYFNVPYGSRKNPVFPELLTYAPLLRKFIIEHRNATEVISESRRGDVVYLDPPYEGTFDSYQRMGFTQADHVALADAAKEAISRGVKVIITNADNSFVRKTFSFLNFEKFVEPRGFRSKTKATTSVCLLGVSRS
jgi:DNA adenine methylase